MPVALRDIDELRRLILIYVPLYPARQLVGDLYRSRASERNASLKETLARLRDALRATPTTSANQYEVEPRGRPTAKDVRRDDDT